MSLLDFIKKKYLHNDANVLNKIKSKFNFKGTDCTINSFGEMNKDKIFYVIQRSPGAGLFSNLIFILNHLNIAQKHGFIPFIDMENFSTIYNEKNKIFNTKNAWEYYFEPVSKFSKKDVYKSKKVIITHNKFYKFFSHNLHEFNTIFKKYIKIKKIYNTKANIFIKKNFLNKKILAVHYRGTSYKTSAGHPYPTTFKQITKKIDRLIYKKNYQKIFLCTEDLNMFNKLKKKYDNNICYYNSFRSKKDDAFIKYPRKNHRYLLGEEILIESFIISKCHGFIFVDSNVSNFVKFISKIRLYRINNGFNSLNEYSAKWLWYIKFILPSFIGGFKKDI